jgi:hypothetical protein
MHIEPGVVDGTKIVLSYATAVAAGGYATKLAVESVRETGVVSVGARTVATTALVFSFFEILPHFPVGVSEVHFIFCSCSSARPRRPSDLPLGCCCKACFSCQPTCRNMA